MATYISHCLEIMLRKELDVSFLFPSPSIVSLSNLLAFFLFGLVEGFRVRFGLGYGLVLVATG